MELQRSIESARATRRKSSWIYFRTSITWTAALIRVFAMSTLVTTTLADPPDSITSDAGKIRKRCVYSKPRCPMRHSIMAMPLCLTIATSSTLGLEKSAPPSKNSKPTRQLMPWPSIGGVKLMS
eukprot:3249460-Ditylum_brightwellii.AAC.1